MTTFEEFLPVVQPIVEQVASEYGRKTWRHGATNEDYSQELYCYLIENEQQVAEWLAEYEPKQFERFLARVLRNECKDYARDIKAQALGFERRDEFFYSRGEVKALLPAVFDPEAWLNPPQSEGRTEKRPSEGNNWATTLADVAAALDKLDAEDQVIEVPFVWPHRKPESRRNANPHRPASPEVTNSSGLPISVSSCVHLVWPS